jgi:hypothetical protein
VGRGVHEVDVVGDVDPVQRDVGEQLADAQLLQLQVVLLQQAPVRAHRVYDPSHFQIFFKLNNKPYHPSHHTHYISPSFPTALFSIK